MLCHAKTHITFLRLDMVASGLPTPNDDNHADILAKIALKLLEYIRSFKMNHLPEKAIQLRLGIHSGNAKFK